MDEQFVKDTCKIGQGADCCKYITMGADGWVCAKTSAKMKAHIDARTDMKAMGDNCPGFGVTVEGPEQ